MLKKISLGLILGTLLILFSTPQQVVRADQLESRATIKLHPESPTKPVDPVDPNNPDQEYPGDETDDGNLTLKAPSSNVSDRPQIITKKISLGAYNNVMRANNGQGLGTWVLGFPKNQQNPTKLILNNLNDAPADHYFGVLNWSLTDAPN